MDLRNHCVGLTFCGFWHEFLLDNTPFPVPHMGWPVLDLFITFYSLLPRFLFECYAISRWYLGNFLVLVSVTIAWECCIGWSRTSVANCVVFVWKLKSKAQQFACASCQFYAMRSLWNRMEFEFSAKQKELMTDQLNGWIMVRLSNGDSSRWAARCEPFRFYIPEPSMVICAVPFRREYFGKIREFGYVFYPDEPLDSIARVVIYSFHPAHYFHGDWPHFAGVRRIDVVRSEAICGVRTCAVLNTLVHNQ